MDYPRNPLKAPYSAQIRFCKDSVAHLVNPVLNIVFTTGLVLAVYLQIDIAVTAPRYHGGKGAFSDDTILPGEWENIVDGNIVNNDSIRIPGNRLAAVIDRLASDPRDIGHSAKRGFHFLHLIGLNREVVLRKNPVDELLFFFPFQRDLDLLVHQEISPIFADLFPHAERGSPAAYPLIPVIALIAVEVLHIPHIPGAPNLHLVVKVGRDSSIVQLI